MYKKDRLLTVYAKKTQLWKESEVFWYKKNMEQSLKGSLIESV